VSDQSPSRFHCTLLSINRPPLRAPADGSPSWCWNCFDFTIAFLTFPWLPLPEAARVVGQVARVMRIVKLLRRAKQVQVITGALMAGGHSITVIFLLLVLVWILYGTIGTIYLGANDPVRIARTFSHAF
jgi:hypothetical protein